MEGQGTGSVSCHAEGVEDARGSVCTVGEGQTHFGSWFGLRSVKKEYGLKVKHEQEMLGA